VPRNPVAAVAERLMEATASTAAPVSEQVLAQLVEHYNADASFLRRNDHGLRASVLIAEWPPRPDVPARDPLASVLLAAHPANGGQQPQLAVDYLQELCAHISVNPTRESVKPLLEYASNVAKEPAQSAMRGSITV
jgi:hypothetical protein